MKTSSISNVSSSVPLGKKSKFNFSHDNNTTYDWGSVQPIFGKMLLPDSSINLNCEQLTRLAPMVCPTFGRVKIKNISHFIPCDEIWPNWQAMLSQTKVTRSAVSTNGTPIASTYIPKSVPHIQNNIIASFVLAGSSFNLYVSGQVGTAAENTWYCYHNTENTSGSSAFTSPTPTAIANNILASRDYLNIVMHIQNSLSPSTNAITPFGYTGFTLSTKSILTDSTGAALLTGSGVGVGVLPSMSTMFAQPLAGANGTGFTHSAANESYASGMSPTDMSTVNPPISFEGADLIWEYAGSTGAGILATDRASGSGTPVEGAAYSLFDGCKIRIVFRLSSFGKRLRKVLIGLGYDVNLSNDDDVSLLPLLSYYKAWWDVYAPERTRNFYETYAWKLINACMSGATGTDLLTWINDTNGGSVRSYFRGFFADLGTCFATEKMDVISAATDKYYASTNTTTDVNNVNSNTAAINQAIQAVLYDPMNGVAGPDGSFNVLPSTGSNNAFTNPRDTLSLALQTYPVALTQPQIDALKKAYIMINKTSVAGMKVEEILRALGLGDYVEECKGKFIAGSDDSIKISDVVATAATDDAELGQYGGRGIGYGKFQFSFKARNHGFLFVLSAIVPESGYVNGPDKYNEITTFEKLPNPELDGLAYEAIEKKSIMGSPLINDPTYRQTFGFLPTYSQFKFMSNKANGDFSLNSRKQYLTPYTLDKMIPVSDVNVYRVLPDYNGYTGTTAVQTNPQFKYSDLPNAGEDYRFINKFPWNGSFNRIFSEQGDGYNWSVFSPNNNQFLYNSFEFDNFMQHCVFDIQYFCHLKSIEDSYGTYDEEHGAPNSSIKRS